VRFVGDTRDIESSFEVHGNLNLPEISSIDTVVETWVPINDHVIIGTFVMPWVDENGIRIPGIAQTKYHLEKPIANELKQTAHRVIRINSDGTDRKFERDQRAHLFGAINEYLNIN
jgi:hypothetical protein